MTIPARAPYLRAILEESQQENLVLSSHDPGEDEIYTTLGREGLRPYEWYPATPFEATMRIALIRKPSGVWLQDTETGTYYSISHVTLMRVLQRGVIVTGYVRGVWQVVKDRSGYSLDLAVPQSLEDGTPLHEGE